MQAVDFCKGRVRLHRESSCRSLLIVQLPYLWDGRLSIAPNLTKSSDTPPPKEKHIHTNEPQLLQQCSLALGYSGFPSDLSYLCGFLFSEQLAWRQRVRCLATKSAMLCGQARGKSGATEAEELPRGQDKAVWLMAACSPIEGLNAEFPGDCQGAPRWSVISCHVE